MQQIQILTMSMESSTTTKRSKLTKFGNIRKHGPDSVRKSDRSHETTEMGRLRVLWRERRKDKVRTDEDPVVARVLGSDGEVRAYFNSGEDVIRTTRDETERGYHDH